ncbi:MAG TPA: hypothetical protein VLC09_03650 [Polyangiaceae bacterium]|nr:hypothetical protein [Polyangiaceae bacterium]
MLLALRDGWLARTLGIASLALAAVVVSPGEALAQSMPPGGGPDAGNPPQKWPHALPLFGGGAATRGIKMPLPFGVGLNYAFVDQQIDISRVAVGVNGSELTDISDVIVFDNVNSQLHAMNARFDVWILPFLNLYGMGNYVIQADTAVSVSEPFAFNAGAVQSGAGGGFGGTFAAGLWGFFITLDLNWTWNKMEKLADPVGTYLLTPRLGRNLGKHLGVEWIVWVGAMRQQIESHTRGEIRLREALEGADMSEFQQKVQDWYDTLGRGQQAVFDRLVDGISGADPVIQYELDKAVKYPWNMLVGAEIGLSPAWRLRAEVGFIERTQVVLGVNYRFGDGLGGN